MQAAGFGETKDHQKIAIFFNIAGLEAMIVFNSMQLYHSERASYDEILPKLEEYCIF